MTPATGWRRRPDLPAAPGPASAAALSVAAQCRKLVRRQALKAAGVSALPVPGADMFVNAQLLSATVEQISTAFGLAPDQIAALPAPLRSRVDDLALELGSYLIGRVLTEGAILMVVRRLGWRLGVQQAAKLAPIAGLAASAALSGWMFQRLCERHIAQCLAVRRQLPELPPLATAAPLLLPAPRRAPAGAT